jgi:hypothetical protein
MGIGKLWGVPMNKVLVHASCGMYVGPPEWQRGLNDWVHEPKECGWEDNIYLDKEEWEEGFASYTCPSCGANLLQDMDHFELVTDEVRLKLLKNLIETCSKHDELGAAIEGEVKEEILWAISEFKRLQQENEIIKQSEKAVQHRRDFYKEEFEKTYEENKKYKEILEWYANPETYKLAGNNVVVVMMDKGWNARNALGLGDTEEHNGSKN